MSDLIIEKIGIATSVIDTFNAYFTKASLFINILNSEDMTNVQKLIKQNGINAEMLKKMVDELASITPELSFDKLCDQIFHLFKVLKELDNILDNIHELLSVDIRVHERDISTTASAETLSMLNNVLQVYTTYIAQGKGLNDKILMHLAKILCSRRTTTFTMDCAKITQSRYRLWDITVELYSTYINLMLNHFYSNKDPRRYELTEQIEDDKTWQLTQYDILKWNKTRFVSVNTEKITPLFITEWGLIPQSLLRPLQEIYKNIFQVDKIEGDHQSVVHQVAKLKQTSINLIVIEKIMPRSVEHDITKVVGKVADSYRIQDRAGVSQKALEKFNTLTIRSTDLWKFKVSLYTSGQLNKLKTLDSYYIIETIDNISYRILLPYPLRHNNYAVQGRSISKLLRHIHHKKKLDITHSRITEYNKILELKLYQSLKATPKIDLQIIATSSSLNIDIGMVRQKIQIRLMEIYDELIIHGKFNLFYLRDIIFHPKLITQFIDAQISIYHQDKLDFKLVADPTLKRKKFNQNDIFVTFLLHASGGVRDFQREMNDNFHEIVAEISSDDMDTWSYDTRKIQFREIFNNIIDATLKRIFTSENNAYQNVKYKANILNVI